MYAVLFLNDAPEQMFAFDEWGDNEQVRNAGRVLG